MYACSKCLDSHTREYVLGRSDLMLYLPQSYLHDDPRRNPKSKPVRLPSSFIAVSPALPA